MDVFQTFLRNWLNVFNVTLCEIGNSEITLGTLAFLAASVIGLWVLTDALRHWLSEKVLAPQTLSEPTRRRLAGFARWIVMLLGVMAIIDASNIDLTAEQIFSYVNQLLDTSLAKFGKTKITFWTIIYVLSLWTALIIATSRMQSWFIDKVLAKTNADIGVRHAIAVLAKYVVVSLGFIVILQSAGVDLTALTVIASALGLGLSFGLQNITSNLVSGLIVLFERPIKVGDRIEVGGTAGDVKRIALRATTICTNDNIEVIVPNSEFITKTVINWSHSTRDVRVSIPVGVSYKSDPELVRRILLEAAFEHPGVLETPEPLVFFKGFGANSLDFDLRVSTRDYIALPSWLRSDLNFTIFRKFKENQVEIPFPQRDLHIRTSEVPISLGVPPESSLTRSS